MKQILNHIYSYLLVILLICVITVCPETLSQHDKGNPFVFSYAVKDELSRNDFGHEAKSDGDIITGEYRTLLPDGRIQTVRYQADWKNGYKAEVTYSGNAIWENDLPTNGEAPARAFGSPGPQPCSDETVGLNCNPATSVGDTKPDGDF